MATSLQTENAPSIWLVVPHFVFGALAFLTLTILYILAGADLLGPFFGGKILAITHLAVLGWGTMIIFGALYQLIPVVFETALFSEKLGHLTFWVFAISIILLVYSFWNSAFTTILLFASTFAFTALALFIVNVLLSTRKGVNNIHTRFVSGAVIWLLSTALLGLLISFNFKYQFFSELHLHYLKVHAHLGLIGWFVSLIIGVSTILIPMFLVSHGLNEKRLNHSFYLINGGLLLLTLDWLTLRGTVIIPLYWLLISIGIIFYLSYVKEAYTKRLRKQLDVGMKHTVISVLSLIIPIVVSFIIQFFLNLENPVFFHLTTLYGFSIIFGLITPIILGQTYKTLPFIVWLDKYKQYVGKNKTPMPKDLYSNTLAVIQMYAYFLGIISIIWALLFSNNTMLNLGGYLLLVTAIIYNINVFKIVLHKTKLESL